MDSRLLTSGMTMGGAIAKMTTDEYAGMEEILSRNFHSSNDKVSIFRNLY